MAHQAGNPYGSMGAGEMLFNGQKKMGDNVDVPANAAFDVSGKHSSARMRCRTRWSTTPCCRCVSRSTATASVASSCRACLPVSAPIPCALALLEHDAGPDEHGDDESRRPSRPPGMLTPKRLHTITLPLPQHPSPELRASPYASQYLEVAVAAGIPGAYYYLGAMAEYGAGRHAANYTRALGLYGQGCAKGDVESCYNRLLMIAYGRGTRQDFHAAVTGFQALWDSTGRKHGPSAYYLGIMHAHGQGVPIDYALARFFLQEAMGSGDKRVYNEAAVAYRALDGALERAEYAAKESVEGMERALHESLQRHREGLGREEEEEEEEGREGSDADHWRGAASGRATSTTGSSAGEL